MLLGSHLLAVLDYKRRFDTGERAQLGSDLGDVALVPLPLPILKRDRAIRVIKAHDEVLLLLPDLAPHRYTIKTTIQQPGDSLVLFEPSQGLTHRPERLLHLGRLTDKNQGPGC